MSTLRSVLCRRQFTSPVLSLRHHPRITLPHLYSTKLIRCYSAGGGSDYQPGPANELQPQPSTQRWEPEEKEGAAVAATGSNSGGSSGGHGGGGAGGGGRKNEHSKEKRWKEILWKALESAAATTTSLAILGLAGYCYYKYYKRVVFQKTDNAFNQGDDPALHLAKAASDGEEWYLEADFSDSNTAESFDERCRILPVSLDEQAKIDRIINGEEKGHYYLIIGEKGTGKTSMILSAMHKNQGEACSMMEAHANPEIFRIRLGRALDFEFHEDYVGSLFSIRGPRDTTALLDIERALNKLEKVALKRRKCSTKPLIMIINGMHLLRNDENGADLLELLQQRAEAWAASGLVTMVFNSDDYWVYERMRQYGSRMELVSVRDLSKQKALGALKKYRIKYRKENPSPELLEKVYERIGGRLAYLNRVAKADDMLAKCDEICQTEKSWLLSQCGLLGENMDDDVMDQQKFASSAMLLVRKLVEMQKNQEEEMEKEMEKKLGKKMKYDPEVGRVLPELPLHDARKVMTRADFIEKYDHINIFTIDSKANVRADSVPMQNAFREVVDMEGFDEFLEETLQRISDIESLGRTRELTIKDLWDGGKYNMTVKNHKGHLDKTVTFDVTPGKIESDGED